MGPFFFLNDNENYTKRLFCIYTYFKKCCRGEGRLHDRNELGVPFVMQNFIICAAHAYACVASENQAFQLVYPFSSKGIATQVKFCIPKVPTVHFGRATSVLPDNVV